MNEISNLLLKSLIQSSIFHTLFDARSPNSDLGRAQKSLASADLANLP